MNTDTEVARRRTVKKEEAKIVHIEKTIHDPKDFESSDIKDLMDRILDFWEESEFKADFKIRGNKLMLSGFRLAKDDEETSLFDEEADYYEGE